MTFFSEYKDVMFVLNQKHPIVFYAESRHYYQYFKKLIQELLSEKNITICYITSDKNDPLLTNSQEGIKVYYVNWLLGFLFAQYSSNSKC